MTALAPLAAARRVEGLTVESTGRFIGNYCNLCFTGIGGYLVGILQPVQGPKKERTWSFRILKGLAKAMETCFKGATQSYFIRPLA